MPCLTAHVSCPIIPLCSALLLCPLLGDASVHCLAVGGSEGQMLGHASPPWVHSQSTPRPQHFHSSGQVTFPGQAEPELALAESAITNHAGAQGEGTCEVQRAFAE